MADAIVVALVVIGAVAFLVWRFRTKPSTPACGAVPEAKPQVIVGSRLARGLESVRKSSGR